MVLSSTWLSVVSILESLCRSNYLFRFRFYFKGTCLTAMIQTITNWVLLHLVISAACRIVQFLIRNTYVVDMIITNTSVKFLFSFFSKAKKLFAWIEQFFLDDFSYRFGCSNTETVSLSFRCRFQKGDKGKPSAALCTGSASELERRLRMGTDASVVHIAQILHEITSMWWYLNPKRLFQ